MKKNTFFILGMLAVVLTFGVLLTACSKKAEAQAGGDVAGAVKDAAGAVKTAASGGGKEAPASDFRYDLTKDGKGIVITHYTGTNPALVIPAEIEGYPVVQIGNGERPITDATTTKMTSVVIPENVQVIKASAFSSNLTTGLQNVSFPSSLTTIENLAFQKTALQNVDLSHTSLTKLGGDYYVTSYPGAFYLCKNLQTVKLPDSVTVIGAGTFEGCYALTDINIPASIQSIGVLGSNESNAGDIFNSCGALNNLTIPDSITKIKFVESSLGSHGNFKGCGKLPLTTRQRLKDLGYKGEF